MDSGPAPYGASRNDGELDAGLSVSEGMLSPVTCDMPYFVSSA
jgi:hypothetical protein